VSRTVTDIRGVRVECAGILTELEWTVARLARIEHRPAPALVDPDGHLPLTAAVTRSPMHEGASVALGALRAQVHGWARILAEESSVAINGDPVVWLAGHVDSVRLREWGPDCHREVMDSVARAEQIIDQPPELVFAGVCPGGDRSCGVELWALPGAGVVQCRSCGVPWDVAEVRTWLLRTAEDRELTATEIGRAMSVEGRQVTAAMVRGWAASDRRAVDRGGSGGFAATAVNDRGQPLYRLGDALDRWARSQGLGATG
jgi:hypothetical protein